MESIVFSWPEGKKGAVTTSWDDGTTHDRRLVKIMDTYGIRGTFNLNSGKLGMSAAQSGWKEFIQESEVKELFKNHEVASHTVTHPPLWKSPTSMVTNEVMEDRRNLERLVGYPVTGFAYPFGGPDDERVKSCLRSTGFAYARSIRDIKGFGVPLDFFFWETTCHIGPEATRHWHEFLECGNSDKLFFLWGHSYEYDERNNWEEFEALAREMSGHKDFWYATNIEICRYLMAWRRLVCSVDMTLFTNETAVTLYFTICGKLHTIRSGETLTLTGVNR